MKSRVEIGNEFEMEAFEYLKKIFVKVNWLSRRSCSSRYDFNCFNGKKWVKVEAKRTTTMNKPTLRYKQRNADFIIFKGRKNEIKLIPREDFEEMAFVLSKQIFPSDKDISSIPYGLGVVMYVGRSLSIVLNPKWVEDLNLEVGDKIDIEDAVKKTSISKENKKRLKIK